MLDPLLEIILGQAWCSFAFKSRTQLRTEAMLAISLALRSQAQPSSVPQLPHHCQGEAEGVIFLKNNINRTVNAAAFLKERVIS